MPFDSLKKCKAAACMLCMLCMLDSICAASSEFNADEVIVVKVYKDEYSHAIGAPLSIIDTQRSLIVAFTAFETSYLLKVSLTSVVGDHYSEATIGNDGSIEPIDIEEYRTNNCLFRGHVEEPSKQHGVAMVSTCKGIHSVEVVVQSSSGDWLEVQARDDNTLVAMMVQTTEPNHVARNSSDDEDLVTLNWQKSTVVDAAMRRLRRQFSTVSCPTVPPTDTWTVEILMFVDYEAYLSDGSDISVTRNRLLQIFSVMQLIYHDTGLFQECNLELVLVGQLICTSPMPTNFLYDHCDSPTILGLFQGLSSNDCCTSISDADIAEKCIGDAVNICVDDGGCNLAQIGCVPLSGSVELVSVSIPVSQSTPEGVVIINATTARYTFHLDSTCQADVSANHVHGGVLMFSLRFFLSNNFQRLNQVFGSIDNVVFFTGFELTGDPDQGFSDAGTMCSVFDLIPEISHSVNEWNNPDSELQQISNVARLVAHELGNNFGAPVLTDICHFMSEDQTTSTCSAYSWSNPTQSVFDTTDFGARFPCTVGVISDAGAANCGDGIVEGDEECEPGTFKNNENAFVCVDGSFCSAGCRFEACASPTRSPTTSPTVSPQESTAPTASPSLSPSLQSPSLSPTIIPTPSPTLSPVPTLTLSPTTSTPSQSSTPSVSPVYDGHTGKSKGNTGSTGKSKGNTGSTGKSKGNNGKSTTKTSAGPGNSGKSKSRKTSTLTAKKQTTKKLKQALKKPSKVKPVKKSDKNNGNKFKGKHANKKNKSDKASASGISQSTIEPISPAPIVVGAVAIVVIATMFGLVRMCKKTHASKNEDIVITNHMHDTPGLHECTDT
eukprot:m.213874 g.213874  ORF g.213874 m.213874 type:complete len:834 (-) comp33162_c0_seq5:191-2692(-)